MRVLVTGSRDWPYPMIVRDELTRVLLNQPKATLAKQPFIVVEGACPTGADREAFVWAGWAARQGWNVHSERHPADWKTHGKAAGFIRNQEMVNAGADFCLAFRYAKSRGTTHCLERAIQAEIPYRLIDLETEIVEVY